MASFIEVGQKVVSADLERFGYYQQGNSNIFLKEKGCFVEAVPCDEGFFRVIRAKDKGKIVSMVGFYQPIIKMMPRWLRNERAKRNREDC